MAQVGFTVSGGVTIIRGSTDADADSEFEIQLTGALTPVAGWFVLQPSLDGDPPAPRGPAGCPTSPRLANGSGIFPMQLRRSVRALAALAVAGLALAHAAASAAPTSPRQAGAIDGIWYWTLPDTPNGLHPNQSWSGAGSAGDGSIYVAGMDHVTNSALYRLKPQADRAVRPAATLAYVGDAKAASVAVNDWAAGEVAEKFHTRPLFHNGRVYVATLNYSPLDAGYLTKSGLKWLAFDTATNSFRDLSKTDASRGLVAHGGLVGFTIDRTRGRIYGAVNPTGEIVYWDIALGRTFSLGRPNYQRPYVYPGRGMWVDSAGRVYFSAGNVGVQYGAPYNAAIFDHIRYYDPATGRFAERTGWKLRENRAIDFSQCFPAVKTCFLTDNAGTLYKFTEAAQPTGTPTWEKIGSVATAPAGNVPYNWVLHVGSNRTRAYLLNVRSTLFVFDLVARRLLQSIPLADYDGSLANSFFYGADAWDGNGRFYVVTMPKTITATSPVRLVAIDPARLIAAVAAR